MKHSGPALERARSRSRNSMTAGNLVVAPRPVRRKQRLSSADKNNATAHLFRTIEFQRWPAYFPITYPSPESFEFHAAWTHTACRFGIKRDRFDCDSTVIMRTRASLRVFTVWESWQKRFVAQIAHSNTIQIFPHVFKNRQTVVSPRPPRFHR